MMKRQTVLEYLRERGMLMQEKICPYCNAHLDPGEKCDCRADQGLAEYTYRIVKENERDYKECLNGVDKEIKVR